MNVRIRQVGVLLALALLVSGCGKQTNDTNQNRTDSYSTPFTGVPTDLPDVGKKPRAIQATEVPDEEAMTRDDVTSKKKDCKKESSQTGTYSKEEDYIIVKITSINYEYFMAEAPWQDSIKYIIHAKLGDTYSPGDYVEVVYKDIYELEENQYELDALEVTESTYAIDRDVDYKPVIYLYPQKEMKVKVKLEYSGAITVSSPEYKGGWVVTAKPGGTLIGEDGNEYPYIFWEGIREMSYDINEGFCVSGKDTKEFLQEKLAYMGLSENEIHDFIKFWLPYMKGNAYNLISFQGSAYTDYAKLSVSPKPDAVLRVYMVFKPLKEPIEIKEQKLKPFTRKGFTVVEWGGTIQ